MALSFIKGRNRGIILMLIASFLFALMGVFVKLLSPSLTSIQMVFFRNLVGTAFIIATIYRKPLRGIGGKPFLLIFRGLAGTLSLYALFYNMSTIGLGEAITYLQTSPIYIALIAYFLLHEKISKPGWLAVFLGFLGIVLIFRPNMHMNFQTGAIGLFNGLFSAMAFTSVRELKKIYDTRAIVLSFMLSGMALPIISMSVYYMFNLKGPDFLVSPFYFPHGIEWLWLLLLGFVAMVGQVLMTMAYGEDKAGVISTIGYSNIPFAVILGVLMGDAIPGILGILGMLLIIISGIIISIKRNL